MANTQNIQAWHHITVKYYTFGHFQNLKIDRALILEAENFSKNFHLFVFRLNTLLEETLHEEWQNEKSL